MSEDTRYRTGRRAPFIMVPLDLIEHEDADAFTLAAYCAIRSFCDLGKTTGARCSDAAAAERGGMSPRTFADRRTHLRELGWIDWESGKRRGEPNVYVVHEVGPEPESPRDIGGLQEVQTPPGGRQEMHRGLQEVQTGSARGADDIREREKLETTATPRARLEGFLADVPGGASVLDAVRSMPTYTSATELSIVSLYLDGMDPKAWADELGGSVPPSERPALLAMALTRFVGEGQRFAGNFFRGILRKVIREQRDPGPGGGSKKVASIMDRKAASRAAFDTPETRDTDEEGERARRA